MDAPSTISSIPAPGSPARHTSPNTEARLRNLMQMNHQRQVTIIHERNKKVLAAYVTTRNDEKNRLELKGHCQYVKELQQKPKRISTLTPPQQEAYQKEKDLKDSYDQLFFSLLDEHLADATLINWWKQEMVAILLRDPSAPVRLSKLAEFGSFESFITHVASSKEVPEPEKAVLAAQWIVKWNALQASKFLKDDHLRTSIAQIVNQEYIENYQEKTREWVTIKNYLALKKNVDKLGVKAETIIRFGEINTLLHSIVEHLEQFTKLIRMEPVCTLLNAKANQPSPQRMFLHQCIMAKYHGGFHSLIAHVLALITPPPQRGPFPDQFGPSRELQAILQRASTDQVLQEIEGFSKFDYGYVAKINKDLSQLIRDWMSDIQTSTTPVNKGSVDVFESRQLIRDYAVALPLESDLLTHIDHRFLASLLKEADIKLLNSFLQLPSLAHYAHYWNGKEVAEIKTPCFLVPLKNFKYLPILMKLMNQVAIKLEVKKPEHKTGKEAITNALKNDRFDNADPLGKDIDKIYELMHENFSVFCKEALVEEEQGALFKEFLAAKRDDLRAHFKNLFKQYERHSSIRFEEMIAIHHRYKQNVGLLLELIPANHPQQATIRGQFLEYVLTILETSKNSIQNGRPIFNYRKIQAGCPKTNAAGDTCDVKLLQMQGMLRLFHMHIIKNTDNTASKRMLGHLEEAHHVAFPFLFNQSTMEQQTQPNEITAVASQAIKGYQDDAAICFHKAIVDERDWLDVSKFDAAFSELRNNILAEVTQLGPFADPTQILHHLIRGYTFVSMGAMHESSQTLHLLSIANQELDSLSERKIERTPQFPGKIEGPFYKSALAESLKQMLISKQRESILNYYKWYYDGTLNAIEVFQCKITGNKPTFAVLQTSDEKSVPELFFVKDKATVLQNYLDEEMHQVGVVNRIIGKIKEQSSDSKHFYRNGLRFVAAIANTLEITPVQIRQLVNRLIHEVSIIDESMVQPLKNSRNAIVRLLAEKKSFEDIDRLIPPTESKTVDWKQEEIKTYHDELKTYFTNKKRVSLSYRTIPGFATETLLKQRGPQLLNMALLCLSQRIVTAIALKRPFVERIVVEPLSGVVPITKSITTSTAIIPPIPTQKEGNDSP